MSDVNRTALGVLLFCTVISAISRGVSESFAVFLLPIAQEFNADRAATTTSYSIYMVALGLMSPIAGTIFDRLGARLCYSIGLLVMGSAYLIASQSGALWHLYFSTGLGGAIGVSMLGMLPASSLVSRWFQRKLTTAMGVISASLGTGLIIFAPAIQAVIEQYGWRTTFQVLGLLLLIIMMILFWKTRARFRPGLLTGTFAAGIAASREFRSHGEYAGVHRERQIGIAKQLFAAMGIERDKFGSSSGNLNQLLV